MGLLSVVYRQSGTAGKNKAGGRRSSGTDFDRRAVGNGIPDFDDRKVTDRDAALGPVAVPDRRIERPVIARQAVNKDRAAGVGILHAGPFAVTFVGIGDVELARILRVLGAPIDAIDA